MKKLCKLLIPAAVLFLLAGFVFGFVFIGYRFSAMLCFGLAALCILFRLCAFSEKRWVKIFRRVLLTVCCLGLGMALITTTIVLTASTGNPEAECDYIIVLGAAVHGDVPSLSLAERLNAAISYLNAHPDAKCIVSGGKGTGENISEALCMTRYLTGRGIDPARIIPEDQATSTVENLTFSKALMDNPNAQVGIVSSEYHLYRAGQMAKDLGLNAVGIPAHTSHFSLRVNYTLREAAAVWYYWVIGG